MGLFSALNPLSASLPALPSSNPHKVGYLTAYHPPSHPFSLPDPVLESTGEPALKVEEVGWAVFYPREGDGIEGGRKKGHEVPWLVKPVSAIIEGYVRFLGVSKHLLTPVFHARAASTTLPDVIANAPLLAGKHPLLIFSHGLGGGKHIYSQIGRLLASTGVVVLMVDHKDGSGPASALHTSPNGPADLKSFLYVKDEELKWNSPSTSSSSYDSKMPLRQRQLEIRTAEVYEAYHAFSKAVRGEAVAGLVIDRNDGKVGEGASELGLSWRRDGGSVDVEKIAVGGHSFGGATTYHILSNPPPASSLTSTFPKLPISKALLLDPWLDPLPRPDDRKLGEKERNLPPALVINSEGFTLWSSHYNRLASIVKSWGGRSASNIPSSSWLVTVLRSTHHTFSDFPLLIPTLPHLPFAFTRTPPTSTATPASMLETIGELSAKFILGDAGGVRGAAQLKEWDGKVDEGRVETVELEGGKKGSKKVIKGDEGQVLVHFAGP